MNDYLPIVGAVLIALLIWGGAIVGESRATRVSRRWIVVFTLSCLVASLLVSLRPSLQGLVWLTHKGNPITGRDFLASLKELPIGTLLYAYIWDFLPALFPATVAVVVSNKARNFGGKAICSTIAIFLTTAIFDLLRPAVIAAHPPSLYLLVCDLILAPVFGILIVLLTQLIDQFHFPETLRQWYQTRRVALALVLIGVCAVSAAFIPVSSRVRLELADWESMTLRYRALDATPNLYSVLGQTFHFSPLPQRAQWVFVSAKNNAIDLTLTRSVDVGSTAIEIYEIGADIPPRLWYLVPKSTRDKGRLPPHLIYAGNISPGSIEVTSPSPNCWLYNQGKGSTATDFVFSLNVPLDTPITITKEQPVGEEAKPPISDLSPSDTVFDVQASSNPMSYLLGGNQISIFCHGSDKDRQTPSIKIAAQGMPKPIVLRGDGPTLLPGFLIKLGKINQQLQIWSNSSKLDFRIGTSSFNLGQVPIGRVAVKGLRGKLSIDSHSMTLDAGDDVSIGGNDLAISKGAHGEVIVEGLSTSVFLNGIDESRRVWTLIPNDVRTIMISVVTSLITTFVLLGFKGRGPNH